MSKIIDEQKMQSKPQNIKKEEGGTN